MHSKNAKKRDSVAKLCEEGDVDQALYLVREIADPWYRCQSLSYIAAIHNYMPKKYEITREAFTVATWQKEPNRAVTASAWALAVFARFASADEVRAEFERLMAIIAREPHKLRRLDAIFMIANALHPAQPAVLLDAVDALLDACQNCPSWKKDRLICWTVPWLKSVDLKRAEALVELVYLPRMKRRAGRILAGESLPEVSRFSF